MKLCALALLVTAGVSRASTIWFVSLLENHANGTYNGFVESRVDGAAMKLVCDDYLHETVVPSGPFSYWTSTLDSLEHARFSGADRYREAAVLLRGMADEPTRTADYQYAVWQLFTPSVHPYGTSGTLLASAVTLVEHDNTASYQATFDALRIYTPKAGAAGNQEFLGFSSEVPEAGTSLMVGAGMGLLLISAGTARLRRRRGAAATSDAPRSPSAPESEG